MNCNTTHYRANSSSVPGDPTIDQLAAALDRTQLLGFPSNRRLLAACLRHPKFRAGKALIPFLDEHGAEIRGGLEAQERSVALSVAMSTLFPAGAVSRAGSLACPFPRPLRLRLRGQELAVRVRELAGGCLEVEQDGEIQIITPALAARARLAKGSWQVQVGAIDLMVEDMSFEPPVRGGAGAGTGELRAPFNGKVISLQALPGTKVMRGDTLLVLESMKLEHALGASRDGTVKAIHVEAGQQAATGQVLVTLEEVA